MIITYLIISHLSLSFFCDLTAADLIGVQSVDGVLSVFDRESHAFDRPLPGALLPGPFVYIEQTDSFVTVTSSLVLETFRYQVGDCKRSCRSRSLVLL